MITKKKLAVLTSLGWLMTLALAKSRKTLRQRDSNLQRQQVTTWEGEGGNLPPQTVKNSHVALH